MTEGRLVCEAGTLSLAEMASNGRGDSSKRRSLLKRLVRLLVPCLPAHDNSQPLDIDPPPEKQIQKQKTPSPEPQQQVLPPTPDPLITPDLIVSPSPIKTLPVAETEGVTSGAVVPPGSTGNEKHSRASTVPSAVATDAEDEDFTDDEIEDLPDDDPDELILLNGGAGIPVGPVSHISPAFSSFQFLPFP